MSTAKAAEGAAARLYAAARRKSLFDSSVGGQSFAAEIRGIAQRESMVKLENLIYSGESGHVSDSKATPRPVHTRKSCGGLYDLKHLQNN